MPPAKRKRPERQYSNDDAPSPRQSPHRPESLRMGMAHSQQQHHSQQYQQNSPRGGSNGRRQSRNNGRGGSSVPPSPSHVSHNSPTAMSPPVNSFQSHKAAPHTPSAPAPPRAQSPTLNTERKVPESNEHLTPQRVANWNSSARDAVVQAALAAQREGDVLTLSVVFHEIIEATIDQQLRASELGSVVRDIVASPSGDDVDPVSIFLDTLSSLTQDKNKQARVQQMLVATDIDVSRMRNELESDLLGSLGLVRDTFARVAVRKATHALYRQSNYNLLREETEGYAKLMTEYFTTVNSEPPSQDVVSKTYQRVNALIGAFDLDIGRVLDVTLDVFANQIVKHGRFFVKLLRTSAWWPELRGLEGLEWNEPAITSLPLWARCDSKDWYCSGVEKEEQLQAREQRDRQFWQRVGAERAGIQAYFELGARRITANNRQPDHTMPAEGAPLSKQQAARKWADEWIAQTKTLPPPSNDIAAQLLGFKLRFYASDARDAHDFLPDNIMYLAALLIKIGFISIMDLYPHLYPLEEDMPAHKEKLLKAFKAEEAQKFGSVDNALSRAAALPDEMPSGMSRMRDAASKTESDRNAASKAEDATEKKKVLPEPADQKHSLLKSLLCIGALPEALFILGRHPWMLEVYPDLHEFIFRIAHYSISKVYEDTRLIPTDNKPAVPKGAGLRTSSRPSDFIARRSLRWAKPDLRDAGDGIDYKFYWEDWVDTVPVCLEVDDVVNFCTSFLGLLGAECGKDVVFLTKIVRIGKKSLKDDASQANRKRWSDFCATFICPALSYTNSNPGIINEVWELFKHFDTATRYVIYQEWFGSRKLMSIFQRVEKTTKRDLDRVSTTNTKEYGRKFAKLSLANPGIVFRHMVTRLISYPNMIDTLVECVRYLPLLGYDCLTWSMVKFFMRPEKGTVKDDGMLSASWLKNIASFIGKAYQRHSFMDPTPILQFIAHQLLQTGGELYMLDVLEQMIKHMGGINIYASLSENMILSLCAGPVLRTFTFTHHLSDNRHQVGSSARRLAKYLKETGIAPQILIGLAQHLEAYVHEEAQRNTPDKVVLFNLDNLRSSLLQCLELLRIYIDVDDFDNMVPGPIEMISEYAVEPDLAFTIARASIAEKASKFRTKSNLDSTRAVPHANGDVDMKDADEKPDLNGIASTPHDSDRDPSTPNQVFGIVEPSVDAKIDGVTEAVPEDVTSAEKQSKAGGLSNPAIDGLVQQMKAALPETFGQHPCLSFYITFWQLSLPDVDNGGFKQQYQTTIQHWERQLPAAPVMPGRRNYNQNIPRKETDAMRQAKIEIAKLKVEQHETIQASNLTQKHLRLEMWQWFEGVPMLDARSDALHSTLLQDCFLPRSRMSLLDAQFAAAMLKFMHSSGVPGFRTIKLLDLLFNGNKLACMIRMYSDDEALTFGRFLHSILSELLRWHTNKNNAYAKSAHGSNKELPGFGRKFNADREAIEHLQYDDFCNLLNKWHKSLCTALKACLGTGDFQQIRNSLVILTACSGSFPKVDTMATELRQVIEPMSKNDERGDIKTAAGSSLALFKNPEKNFQSEYKFRNLPEPPKSTPTPVNGTNESAHGRSSTPQPQDNNAARLKPTAPAFKPKTETNGTQRPLAQKSDDSMPHRSVPSPSTHAPPSRVREPMRPASKLNDSRSATPSQQDRDGMRPLAGTAVNATTPVPLRPDGRHTPQPNSVGRPAHVLPSRPDAQSGRSRQPERPGVERPLEHGPHSRYENRAPPSDYGRLDRTGEAPRQREPSPGRRGRPGSSGRTPERMAPVVDHREWPARDAREYEDRAMRAPLRDARPPPVRAPAWDTRDQRDQRDRSDSRGHPIPPAIEPWRMASNSSLSHEHNSHRRDLPPTHVRQGSERNEHGPPMHSPAVSASAAEGPTVNPARAALINQVDNVRIEPPRPDRDGRGERGPRVQSPRGGQGRRGEDRRLDERHIDEHQPSAYQGRNDMPREHREDRGTQPAHFNNRERREEPTASTPTGPRGGRNEPLPPVSTAREMFQPRSRAPAQDPNYGRLNQPAEPTPPAGPRSTYNAPNTDPQAFSTPGGRPHPMSLPPTPTPPSGPAGSMSVSVHPSRLENIQRPPLGPALQTNMSSLPSGPRGNARAPPGGLPSPVGRGPPPTGPATSERGPRGGDRRNPLGAINSVLKENAPTIESRSNDRSDSTQYPPVRGRGATRAHGIPEPTAGKSSPMPPPSQVLSPNPRGEGHHARSSRTDNIPPRTEGTPQDDGRTESRGHRDSRRGERSGRDRSRSPADRSERRPDERSTRDSQPRVEGEERGPERAGREKRGSERESSSRREREGERSVREPGREPREPGHEPREPGREPREAGRRERGSRDDGRSSGREERRSRGGGSADDGRKRTRDPLDQGQGHGDPKRRR